MTTVLLFIFVPTGWELVHMLPLPPIAVLGLLPPQGSLMSVPIFNNAQVSPEFSSPSLPTAIACLEHLKPGLADFESADRFLGGSRGVNLARWR